MSLFLLIQWPTSNSWTRINVTCCILAQGQELFFTNPVFFYCDPCYLVVTICPFILVCDKMQSDPRQNDHWALIEPFVFAAVQDEDQRWDGPEEADPVPGGVHGAPREDEASSTGWVRELSSEDGGHAALHGGSGARVREPENYTSSTRPSVLIVCICNLCSLLWSRGASSVSHHQCWFCGHHWHKDRCPVTSIFPPAVFKWSQNIVDMNIVILGSWWHLQPVNVLKGRWNWAVLLCSQSHGTSPPIIRE